MYKNMDEALEKLLCEEGHEDEYEMLARTVAEEIVGDDENPCHVGLNMLRAYCENDVNEFCIALTGWSMESLLKRAGILQDTDHTFS